MTALGWISAKKQGRFATRLGRDRAPSSVRRSRGLRPSIEGLETIALLATTCPTISGFVFLDENPTNPALTNNGLFDAGEAPISAAQVELLDSSNRLVATTSTNQAGAYSFGGPTTGAPMTITQTVALGSLSQPNVPTNFTNQPLVPGLQLFNPSLGTLQSVQVSSDVVYNSTVTISNQSRISPATGISAMLSGASYQINGLGPSLTISGTPMKSATAPDLPPWNGQPNQQPTATLNLNVEQKQAPVLTDAQSLAFYTAQSGQTTITPTMTGLGGGTGTATNGNAQISQSTFVAANVTVTYTYIPASTCLLSTGQYTIVQTPTPANVVDGKASENGVVFANPGSPQKLQVTVNSNTADLINNDFAKLTAACPVPGTITRFGIHRQKTQLVLPFTGAVDPTLASNPNNYTVIASPTDHIAIISAKFNAATNSVTLIPARRLNVHYHFTLSFHLPCPSGSGQLVNVPFGGKSSLGGFFSRYQTFIPLKNGHLGL